jgi:hypothetical protein
MRVALSVRLLDGRTKTIHIIIIIIITSDDQHHGVLARAPLARALEKNRYDILNIKLANSHNYVNGGVV